VLDHLASPWNIAIRSSSEFFSSLLSSPGTVKNKYRHVFLLIIDAEQFAEVLSPRPPFLRHTGIVVITKVKGKFIEPMLLVRSAELPDEDLWLKEIKLDGYRAPVIKTGGKVELRSRNDNDFSERYPAIATALAKMPDETVIDGEVVAIDESGHPSFNLLQNYGSSKGPLLYYTFDLLILLVLAGKNVMGGTPRQQI
jgi:ATP-dependent DNA ligase